MNSSFFISLEAVQEWIKSLFYEYMCVVGYSTCWNVELCEWHCNFQMIKFLNLRSTFNDDLIGFKS